MIFQYNKIYQLYLAHNTPIYLIKSKKALDTLYQLKKSNTIASNATKLLKTYSILKTFGLATTFGKILKKDFKKYRDELIISSKAGYLMWPGPYGEWGSKKYLMASLDQSLKRMGLDYVDIFYSHRPDPNTPLEETMGALDLMVKQGKALYVGISSYNDEDTKKAAKILKDLGTPCIIHQPKYNMFDRWVEDGLLDTIEKEGIGTIVFSPLAQGMLTDRYLNGFPEDSRAVKDGRFLNTEQINTMLSKIKSLNKIAQERGQSLAQMAISWILKDDRITSVLIGASKTDQILDSLKATNNTTFLKEEIDKIESVLG